MSILQENREILIKHIQWLEDTFDSGSQEVLVAKALRQVCGTRVHDISNKDGFLYLGDMVLVVRHQDGDCDTIDAKNPNMDHLVSALYDAYQVSDNIKYGDQFTLNGEIIANCVDVHVIAKSKMQFIVLTNYNFNEDDLAKLYDEFKVKVVDDSGAPHHVVFMGERKNIIAMVATHWEDHFESDSELQDAIVDSNYVATWGEGYSPETQLVTKSFFSEENSYDTKAISRIEKLVAGQTVDLSDPSGFHTVKRLY